MCGFAGIFSAETGNHLGPLAEKMASVLAHRGPDDSGQWSDPDAGIALGHRRLAVIDLSDAGHQPMASACGRYVIAFNGEIYNHALLRSELEKSQGFSTQWRGHSDTETLLAAFAQWGIEATLDRVVGMFAIALWDREERRLHLVRDRVGEKPLYYGWAGKVFLFGSELKAFHQFPGFAGDVDRNALALFFRFNYVPGPHSVFRNIYKLEPGCLLSIDVQGTTDPVAEAPGHLLVKKDL